MGVFRPPAPYEMQVKNPTYECFILALTILSLVNLVLVLVIPQEETADIIRIVDFGISAILLLDFGYRLSSAPGKIHYVFREYGWLDFIGSLPIPVLRIARVYRVVAVAMMLHPVRHGLVRTMLSERAGTALLGVVIPDRPPVGDRQRPGPGHRDPGTGEQYPHRIRCPVVDVGLGHNGGLRGLLSGDQ